MSCVGSSNRKVAHDTGFEEKENLAIHRQEGLDVTLADAIPPRYQPSFFKPRAVKQVRRTGECES